MMMIIAIIIIIGITIIIRGQCAHKQNNYLRENCTMLGALLERKYKSNQKWYSNGPLKITRNPSVRQLVR